MFKQFLENTNIKGATKRLRNKMRSFPVVLVNKIRIHTNCCLMFTVWSTGAHTLERVGEMKSQKICKGGLFDSVDEKGVLVKRVEQEWGFRSYSEH